MNPVNKQALTAERSSGILMHITSLTGPPFIGDLGNCSKRFAEFLYRSNQTIWQMLPVQPVSAEQGYSPYSSSSAMAGNPLLISMEMLYQEGWLDKKDVPLESNESSSSVAYAKAEQLKEKLLTLAYINWKQNASEEAQREFLVYCSDNEYWLNDYALYAVLKHIQKNKPWYEWAEGFRYRDTATLQQFAEENSDAIRKVKWIQMLFHQQWHQLKYYCDGLQIKLVGDVPIYVAHDSCDVWSHQNLFTIDKDGSLTEVAGVPPDLFNDDGQLWGMPLFKWDVLKEKAYEWWIQRLQKNLQLFDIIRLDHFRGFSSYWSVPADARTAKSGTWKPGPRNELFENIRAVVGDLPFIAEDLGEIDEPVYILRDELQLPGMNVLQFAFGDDMPLSPYLSHHHIPNSIVYTGTHDNNTTVGWYKELGRKQKKHLKQYLGQNINARNVSEQLCRLAQMSVSNWAILPMQDVLSLDGSARMNMPASAQGNWTWRLEPGLLNSETEKKLNEWAFIFNRLRKKNK